MADILDRFIDDIQATGGDLAQAEIRFRQREGGCDGGYIRKAPRGQDRHARNQQACQAIGNALASGSSLAQAFAAADVGRSAGYRHLRRRVKPASGG